MARILGFMTNTGSAVSERRIRGAEDAARGLAAAALDPTSSEGLVALGGRAYLELVKRETEPARVEVDSASQVALVCDGAPQRGERVLGPTELLELYLGSGPDALARSLDGAWIIVVADGRTGRLHLIRDRIGLKPLHYSLQTDGLAYASSAGSLIRAGWASSDFDADVVAKYATSNYRMVYGRPETFFREVSLLAPATVLTYDGKKVEQHEYWDPDPTASYLDVTQDELDVMYREKIAATLRDFLAPRGDRFMVSLSGGMDSSTLLAMLHVVTGRRIDAISCTYREDTTFDETRTIMPSVEAHADHWHDHEPTGEQLATDLADLYGRFDQPLATVSQYVGESVGRTVRGLGYRTLFTGAGGDYLQAGNYPNFLYYLADLKAQGDETQYLREVDAWAANHGTAEFPKSRQTAEDFFEQAVDWSVPGSLKPIALPLGSVQNLLDPDLISQVSLSPIMVSSYGTYLRSYTAQDYKYEGVAPGIPAEDVSGWVYGIEAVEPYFAEALIDFGWRIPPQMKIHDGVNKVTARRAMRGIVPDEILDKTSKQGWNAPTDQWFRGPLRELLTDVISSESFRSRGIYRPEAVDELVQAHLDGKTNQMMLLWQVLNLELWLREWIDA